MLTRAAALLVALSLLSLSSPGQQPDLNPSGDAEHPVIPTVTFTLDWPGADPEHYVLTVDSSARAAYESAGGTRFLLGDPYSVKFTIATSTRDRIFDLTRALDYFHRDVDYKKGKIAFTGRKTLSYADSARNFQTSYNWSDNASARQLTDLLQGIATTLEFGRALDYLHRHDRLGLNAELKRMDEVAANGQLAELQVLAPQLESIAGDSSVMEIARQKARRLLQRADANQGKVRSQATINTK